MDAAADRTNPRLTFVVLAWGVGAYAVLQSLVLPVLPTVQGALRTSQANVTWVLTAYLLSAAIFTPILGRLGDMSGKKRMFVSALGALAVGSLLAAVATSLTVMIIARVIQGVGGGVVPLAFGIVRDEFPHAKVQGAIGGIAAVASVGVGVGIVLAGPIVDSLGYHWLFWLPLIMTTGAAIAAQFMVPESLEKAPGRINWSAAILLSGWLVCLLLAVSEAPEWGWVSLRVLALEGLTVVLVTVWCLLESRTANPLIDMRMMQRRGVWTTNLVALLIGVGLYAMFSFLPEFVQTPSSAGYGFGASVTESGLMILPMGIGMFVFGMFTGRLGARFGSKNVVIGGTVLLVISFLMVAFAHDRKVDIYVAMSIMGLGLGLAVSGLANLIVAAVPPTQTGVASGMNANIRTIGGAIGAAIMTSIVASGTPPGHLPRESGYTNGFLMLAGSAVLSLLAALMVPSIRRDRATHHEPAVDLRHPELAGLPAAALWATRHPDLRIAPAGNGNFSPAVV